MRIEPNVFCEICENSDSAVYVQECGVSSEVHVHTLAYASGAHKRREVASLRGAYGLLVTYRYPYVY